MSEKEYRYMATKEKKSLYNDLSLLISTLFFKLNDRRCVFLYTGLMSNTNCYFLATTKDTDIRKSDKEFAINIVRITDDELNTKIKEFFNFFEIDLCNLSVINLKTISSVLNKVKWDFSKLKIVTVDNIKYIQTETERIVFEKPYDHYFTSIKFDELFALYYKIFNPQENNIDLFKYEYNSFDKTGVSFVSIPHGNKELRFPILGGLDVLNINDIPKDKINFSGFVYWKSDSNFFTYAYLCDTNEFQSIISRTDLILFDI